MADLMALRRRILLAADPDLPPGYKRVDYIRAKSSAYINTTYVPVRYDEIETEFAIKANYTGLRSLFSAGTGTYQLVLLTQNGSNPTYLRYFSNEAPADKFDLQNDTWYNLTLSSGGKLTLNGKSVTYTYLSEIDGANNNLYIFRRRNNASTFLGKLRQFRITNNGTLKVNLIPCIRASDGKAGAYDTVARKFYGSADTEEFTPSTLDT